MEFSLWRQLKRRLWRGRRRILPLGCMAAFFLLVQPPVSAIAADPPKADGNKEAWIEQLKSYAGKLPVKLRKVYICGEEISLLGEKTASEMIDLRNSHPDWNVAITDDGIVFEEQIDDLAETCKGSAYISLDKAGNLSLFDGPPKKEKVVRTFFQLDVEYMESSLPKERVDQLNQGIRIHDKDEYLSVLSTFSDFAVERSEKVMKMKK